MSRLPSPFAALAALAVLGAAGGMAFGKEEPPEALAFFESKIRPVFAEHCYGCHSADE